MEKKRLKLLVEEFLYTEFKLESLRRLLKLENEEKIVEEYLKLKERSEDDRKLLLFHYQTNENRLNEIKKTLSKTLDTTELNIIYLSKNGLNYAKIGERLGYSEIAIKIKMKKIKEKLKNE